MVTMTDCVQKKPTSFCRLSIPCLPNDDGKTRIVANATAHSTYKSRAHYAAYICVYTCVVDCWIEQASGIVAGHDSYDSIRFQHLNMFPSCFRSMIGWMIFLHICSRYLFRSWWSRFFLKSDTLQIVSKACVHSHVPYIIHCVVIAAIRGKHRHISRPCLEEMGGEQILALLRLNFLF
jgi:hypothetical protein